MGFLVFFLALGLGLLLPLSLYLRLLSIGQVDFVGIGFVHVDLVVAFRAVGLRELAIRGQR